MGGLRKLRRSQDREYAKSVARIASHYGRKLSEVLLEFAEPLTATAPTEEDFRVAVEIALVAWNLSFLPPDEQAAFLKESVAPLLGEEREGFAEIERIIWGLVARKMALYPQDNRLVVEHQLSGYGHDAHLLVAYEIAQEQPHPADS